MVERSLPLQPVARAFQVWPGKVFRRPEVDQFEPMVLGQDDILGLEVPVDNLVLLVKSAHGFEKVGDVIFVEGLPRDPVEASLVPEFTSLGVLHLEEEMNLVLEGPVEIDRIVPV